MCCVHEVVPSAPGCASHIFSCVIVIRLSWTGLYHYETIPVGVRSIPELTKSVITRGPQTAVLLHHHGVVTACSHGLYSGQDLHETLPSGVRSIPELTIIVITRGPQTAVLLHHHGVVIASSHGLYSGRDLHETLPVGVRSIAELTIIVPTRGP